MLKFTQLNEESDLVFISRLLDYMACGPRHQVLLPPKWCFLRSCYIFTSLFTVYQTVPSGYPIDTSNSIYPNMILPSSPCPYNFPYLIPPPFLMNPMVIGANIQTIPSLLSHTINQSTSPGECNIWVDMIPFVYNFF